MKRRPDRPTKSRAAPARAPGDTNPQRVETKRCAHCGLEKSVDGWPKNAALADGLGAYCRACKRQVERGVATIDEKPTASLAMLGEKLLPPKRRGPPSKLTHQAIDDLCAVLARGHTRKAACAHVGIGERQFREAIAEGLEAKDGPKWEFVQRVMEAEGDGELTLVEIVRGAADIDPQYAKWLLERRHNVDWGRKEQLAVSGVENKPLEVTVVRELLIKRIEALSVRVDSSKTADVAPSGETSPPAVEDGAAETS